MPDLVLLRHGRSTWNDRNLFTGWEDVDLSPDGVAEAVAAGRTLAAEPDLDLRVVHTSVLRRAIRTAELALDAAERSWLPVRRHWRLNERHYGGLQGLDKAETARQHGEAQVQLWRRSFGVRPPALPADDERDARHDPRYRDLAPGVVPTTECLADVVDRMVPYWVDDIVPDLRAAGPGGGVLVVAHGNSLRALRKHLDGISDDGVVDLEIPTGVPYRYRLDDDLSTLDAGYLGAGEAAEA